MKTAHPGAAVVEVAEAGVAAIIIVAVADPAGSSEA